jgi:hypothetical protein
MLGRHPREETMSDELEPMTSTDDGVFHVRTAILEHLQAGSSYDELAAAGAWLREDELDALLAVCRDALDSPAIADELAYLLTHLGDDVIDGRRVYVVRTADTGGRVELIARSATTDEVLVITAHPLRGIRVAERGPGATRTPRRTYVYGKLVYD